MSYRERVAYDNTTTIFNTFSNYLGMLWSRKELVATVAIPITAIILFFLYKYLK